MADWRAATRRHGPANAGSGGSGGDGGLIANGAPLLISAFAICLLSARADAYPGVERCLGRALEALVLDDHLADWEADLEAGRWNAFVAGISREPQRPDLRDHHRRGVLVAMMTSDVVDAYAEQVEAAMLEAADLAESLEPPVWPLGAHIRSVAAGTRERAATVSDHYRVLGERAAGLLFPAPPGGRS
jgi:hypothetical protein